MEGAFQARKASRHLGIRADWAQVLQSYKSIPLEGLWDLLARINAKIRTLNNPSEGSDTQPIKHENFAHISKRAPRKSASRFTMKTPAKTGNPKAAPRPDQQLVELRDELRTVIDARVRPTLRKRTILDLPDELLMEIFAFVAERAEPNFLIHLEFHYAGYQNNYRPIQNLRLTCRRFHDTSSHLLLRFLNVFMKNESLDRLEEISNHPILRKGVQYLAVGPDYYGAAVAKDFNSFARHCVTRLKHAMPVWKANPPCLQHLKSYKDGADPLLRAVAENFAFISAWESTVSCGFHEDTPHHARLMHAYKRYQALYEEQQSQYGERVQRIAKAMANMPHARNLFFTECYRNLEHRLLKAVLSPGEEDRSDRVYDLMLTAVASWPVGLAMGLGRPPLEIIYDLPVAVHEAGVELNSLKVLGIPLMGFTSLKMCREKRDKLVAATCGLRKVHVDGRTRSSASFTDEPEEREASMDYVNSLMTSRSLEEVGLSFYFVYISTFSPELSMGRMLPIQKWPHLQSLNLSGPFQFEDVTRLMEHTKGRMINLGLDGHLLSGSWVETLDLLRGRVSKESNIGRDWLVDGAEFEIMEEDERTYVLGDDIDGPPNRATIYIWGESRANPIQEVIEGVADLPYHTSDEESDSRYPGALWMGGVRSDSD